MLYIVLYLSTHNIIYIYIYYIYSIWSFIIYISCCLGKNTTVTRVNCLIPSGQSGLQGLPATWKMPAEQFRNYSSTNVNSQHFEPLNFPGPQGPSEIPPNHMKPPILNRPFSVFLRWFSQTTTLWIQARVHSPDSILAISWKMTLDLIAPNLEPQDNI